MYLDQLGRLDPTLTGGRGSPRELLLRRWDALLTEDPHRRGYLLQHLLRDAFGHFGINVYESFTRNKGGEQIDGAFEIGGQFFLVECRWRQKMADGRDVDGLRGHVDRSGGHPLGIFFAVNGWSDNVTNIVKQNPTKVIILMDGRDFRTALAGDISLGELAKSKVATFSLKAEPYIGVDKILAAKEC